jgi:hypothetical protein
VRRLSEYRAKRPVEVERRKMSPPCDLFERQIFGQHFVHRLPAALHARMQFLSRGNARAWDTADLPSQFRSQLHQSQSEIVISRFAVGTGRRRLAHATQRAIDSPAARPQPLLKPQCQVETLRIV